MQLAGGMLQGLGTVGLMGGFGGKAASAQATNSAAIGAQAAAAKTEAAAATAAGGLSPMGLAVGSGALVAPYLLRK